MKQFVLLSWCLLLGSMAYGQNFGVFGGFTSTKYDTSGGDYDRELGLEGGASLIYPLQQNMGFRTGAGLVAKNSSAGSFDLSMIYLEIPATIYFTVHPNVHIFGGINFDILLADSCDGPVACNIRDAETLVFNLPLGARININGPHNIEPILEFGLTDISRDTHIANSFSLRYVYMFPN